MNHIDLLYRIRSRDFEAYRQLIDTYGWKLFSHIRSCVSDGNVADEIFQDVMNRFCNSISNPENSDPLEAILMDYADAACRERTAAMMSGSQRAFRCEPSTVHTPQRKKRSGFKTFLSVIIILLLIAGIAAALWVITGLLMEMKLLPEIDLGYDWFHRNIAPWF